MSAILSVNAGSSSLKFALFSSGPDGQKRRARGIVEGIGEAPHLTARDNAGMVLADRRWDKGARHEDFLPALAEVVERALGPGARLGAVGHRVVHGGTQFFAPVLVDDKVLRDMAALTPLAPLHQMHNIAPIDALRKVQPDLPQVACFDTAFHHGLPTVAAHFALPRALTEAGVRRYGFHGLSYDYLSGALRSLSPRLAAGRTVLAHLGNGASMCALLAGKSVDMTMGFTALDGLVMGTRPGSVDAGAILYLQQTRGMTPKALEDMLYKQSGLLGVSGISADMRTLAASADPHAEEAIDLFCYRAACSAGALAVAMGGLDGIVFSAGIGENAPDVRARILDRLAWMGIRLDAARNAKGGKGRISTDDSPVEAWVIPTDEEEVIARDTARLTGL